MEKPFNFEVATERCEATGRCAAETVVYIQQHDDGDHMIVLVGEAEVQALIEQLQLAIADAPVIS